MRFGLWKYTFWVMQKYGHDESAPTPHGVFATNFVDCSTHYYNICNTSSQTVHNIIITRSQLIS